MVVQLGDGERTVKHQPVHHVGQLAQAAAYAGAKAAAGNHQSLGVSLFAGCFADQFPKGKGFPGLNDDPVNPCGRNPQVDRFALLQAHVHPMQPAQQQGGVSLDQARQRGGVNFGSKMFPAQKIFDIPQQILLVQ